jgi:hypothetical protein
MEMSTVEVKQRNHKDKGDVRIQKAMRTVVVETKEGSVGKDDEYKMSDGDRNSLRGQCMERI